ncbi:unnamed protein product [Mytilus coruscus]|uniref:Tantalus-like domain-containing protein n=1 Tax=Mytilus coruscus TaxID=42192 RepID=A0A6J8AV11_MYTCO|nr:unnamed protein product [Mytilus coruscus]
MISSHCHTESLSDNNNVKSFTLLKSVGSEEEKECHIKDLNLRDFNSNSKRRAVSEKVQVSNVQKHVHLLSNDAKSERGVVTDHQQITGQICSHETVQEGSKAPKKAAIKKQSKAKRLSMDSHILPDISSEKLSHDADAKDDKLKKKKSSTARRRSADPVLLARMSEKFGDKAGPSWTCAKKCADVEEVNEKKKDTNIPSLEEEIPKKKRGKPAKRNSDIGLSKLKKQDQDSIDKKDSIFKISSISDKSKIEDGENKDNVLKDDVPKKKKGRPARRKSADPILLSHISKDMVCNDDGICSQRCKNNEAINEIDSQNFDRNRANISNEIKINRRKGRTAGKKLKTSVKLSQIIEEAGDDKNDSGNSSHGSVNSGKDFESLINDNVTSHRINEVDKRGIETEQLTVSETEDLDKNITEREILLNHVNSADFDKIQEFLSMDEKKPIVKSSKSRRRSADALTLSDSVSHSQQDGNSDIPLRRTTRIKRRSIEIYQAGENYQNNDLESFSDSANSQEENNSLGTSESSSGVKAKPARKRKMKEKNVEDIYRNKNYKRPDDRVWETIFECPDELKNPDQLLSKKRFKRSISFECIMPTKIKKRSKKAVDNGWDAKRRKKQQLPDEFVIEKLAELDSIFNS